MPPIRSARPALPTAPAPAPAPVMNPVSTRQAFAPLVGKISHDNGNAVTKGLRRTFSPNIENRSAKVKNEGATIDQLKAAGEGLKSTKAEAEKARAAAIKAGLTPA